MVLVPSAFAIAAQLSAGHGNERSVGAINEFKVANDESILDGDGAEAPEAILWCFHQLDTNLCDLHVRPSLPGRPFRIIVGVPASMLVFLTHRFVRVLESFG